MCDAVMSNSKINIKKPKESITDKVISLENFGDGLMAVESKYGNSFHACMDCKNFNFEIAPEISR